MHGDLLSCFYRHANTNGCACFFKRAIHFFICGDPEILHARFDACIKHRFNSRGFAPVHLTACERPGPGLGGTLVAWCWSARRVDGAHRIPPEASRPTRATLKPPTPGRTSKDHPERPNQIGHCLRFVRQGLPALCCCYCKEGRLKGGDQFLTLLPPVVRLLSGLPQVKKYEKQKAHTTMICMYFWKIVAIGYRL